MFPHSLTYYCSALKNFSSNTFQLRPYRINDVGSSEIVVVELPPQALISADSLCMHFKMSTTASGGTNSFCGAPRHIETLLTRIVVELNGQSIQSCSNLEHVTNLLMQLQSGPDLITKRQVYANGQAQVAPTANLSSQAFKIQHFTGLVSSLRPGIIDTSLLGSVRLHLYLASPSVLILPASGPTTYNYTLSNIYLTCDSLNIDDGIFYSIHDKYLSSGNSYSMLFDNYYTALFSAPTPAQSNRFSVSTQSLDALWAFFLPNHGVASTVNANTGQSDYFKKLGTGVTNWSFNVNNVQHPVYQPDADDAFVLLMNSLGKTHELYGGIDPLITSSTVWKSDFWTAGISLAYNQGDNDRLVSGLSTLGQNASIAFSSTGSGTTTNLMVVCKTTSEIRISAGKNIEIIN